MMTTLNVTAVRDPYAASARRSVEARSPWAAEVARPRRTTPVVPSAQGTTVPCAAVLAPAGPVTGLATGLATGGVDSGITRGADALLFVGQRAWSPPV